MEQNRQDKRQNILKTGLWLFMLYSMWMVALVFGAEVNEVMLMSASVCMVLLVFVTMNITDYIFDIKLGLLVIKKKFILF